MTSFDGLDRRLTARLDERAAPHAPEGLSKAITESIEETPQRPPWATLERWIPMETRAQFGAVPRALVVFALLVLLTLAMATAIAIGASNPPKLPPPFGPAANGLVAFVSDGEIHVIEADGSDRRQITSGLAGVSDPVWSRDGTQLAFWTGPVGEPADLVVTDADGNDPVVVTTSLGGEFGEGDDFANIEWSADGAEIMYSEILPGSDACAGMGSACGSRLFAAKVDGSGATQVGDPDLDARSPALSPDHSTVAFGGGEGADEALYVMQWDGSGVKQLDTGLIGGTWAFVKQSWSADGQRIATKPAGESIVVVELDDAGQVANVDLLGRGIWPTHSPDGSVVESAAGGGRTIWEPGDPVTQVPLPGVPMAPGWAPDSSQLAGVRDGELVILGRDGETIAELGPADDGTPSWQRVAE